MSKSPYIFCCFFSLSRRSRKSHYSDGQLVGCSYSKGHCTYPFGNRSRSLPVKPKGRKIRAEFLGESPHPMAGNRQTYRPFFQTPQIHYQCKPRYSYQFYGSDKYPNSDCPCRHQDPCNHLRKDRPSPPND